MLTALKNCRQAYSKRPGLECILTQLQGSLVLAEPFKDPPQVTSIYCRTKGKTAQITKGKQTAAPSTSGQAAAQSQASRFPLPSSTAQKGPQVPASSLHLQAPGCSLSAMRAPESPTRQRPGFPLDPLPTVLPDDEIMALDKTLSFKSTFYPNG